MPFQRAAPIVDLILVYHPIKRIDGRPRKWQAVASHYHEVFAGYAIRAQDILLRVPNRRIYILPHVQEFLADLDSIGEDPLTRWTLGVRNALEAGDAPPPFSTAEWNLGAQTVLEAGDELPPFPTVARATPEGTDPAVGSGPQTSEQVEHGGAVGSAVGSRHAEGDRDAGIAGQVMTPQARSSTASTTFAAATFPRPAGSAWPCLLYTSPSPRD